MALHCKMCTKELPDPKARRCLSGTAYTALHDLALSRTEMNPSAVLAWLARDQTYLCKTCHTTLTKYASIKPDLDKICSSLNSVRGLVWHTDSIATDFHVQTGFPTAPCSVIW